jgi:protein SCO1/2
MSLAVKMWISLALMLLATYAGYAGWRVYEHAHADVYGSTSEPSPVNLATEKPIFVKDFSNVTLTERSGESFHLKSLEGQVWVASFFFSSCPGPCRQINVAIAGLQKEFADQPIKFASITVDPDNDTPEVLRTYAKGFEADPQRWLFLTGDFEAIRQLCQNVFQMPIDRKVHTERLILVDRKGTRRGFYNTSDPAQMTALRKQIKLVLAEKVLAEKPAEGESPSATASDRKERS